MTRLDYGYCGEKDLNTKFWCYITDVLSDGMLALMTEEGERALISPKDFTHIGNLNDFISRSTSSSVQRFDFINNSFNNDLLHKITTIDGVVHESSEKNFAFLGVLLDVIEKHENAKKVVSVHLPKSYPSMCVTLVKNVGLEPDNDGKFTVGHTYYICRGCLLDEEGCCYADQISSVDELNAWDELCHVWNEEEVDFDIQKGFCGS